MNKLILQLNIYKSKKYLKWKPKLTIEGMNLSIDWYKKVLLEKSNVKQITEEMNLLELN